MMDAIEAKNLVDNDILLKIKESIDVAVNQAISKNDYFCEVEILYEISSETKRKLIDDLKFKNYKCYFNSCKDSCGNSKKYIYVSWREAK